jgi:hypothetical protein
MQEKGSIHVRVPKKNLLHLFSGYGGGGSGNYNQSNSRNDDSYRTVRYSVSIVSVSNEKILAFQSQVMLHSAVLSFLIQSQKKEEVKMG